jgi:CRISPR-associated protein Cmr2
MERYLLAVSLGPVQGFIAQARRTRDLWFGSELLSQLSQRAAESLLQQQAQLIFPAEEQLRPQGRRGPGVANKILATLPADPRPRVEQTREHVRHFLLEKWRQLILRREISALLHPGVHASAEEQLDTLLEFFAAWAPWEPDTPYHRVLEEVEQALAARKALHAFSPWKHPGHGLHKSSLDGGRESVLRRPEERQRQDLRPFRIGPREELDAVGLLKRASPQPGQFIPVPSIGLADWVKHARDRHPSRLEDLRRACEEREPAFTRVRETPRIQALPYDAQLLLPERWRPYFEDVELSKEEAPHFGHQYVQPLLDAMGSEPFPFVACLRADGDRMGATLQELAARTGDAARHRALSQSLATFAQRALALVEEQHQGVLVYAGGDDVLAFLCLPDALACAQALREEFTRQVALALEGTEVALPTLSVGLGVGHVLESLGTLLELGKEAEHLAKGKPGERDGLAVLTSRRGGQQRSWRCPWKEQPLPKLQRAQQALAQGQVTLGKVHELEALLTRLPTPQDSQQDEAWAALLAEEAERILERTGAGLGAQGPKPQDVELSLSGTYAQRREALLQWVELLLVAEDFSRATRHRRPSLAGAAP